MNLKTKSQGANNLHHLQENRIIRFEIEMLAIAEIDRNIQGNSTCPCKDNRMDSVGRDERAGPNDTPDFGRAVFALRLVVPLLCPLSVRIYD